MEISKLELALVLLSKFVEGTATAEDRMKARTLVASGGK